MRKKQNRTMTLVFVVILLTGLSLLLYPTVADYWNRSHSYREIAAYSDAVAALDAEEYETILADARAYNEALAIQGSHWNLTSEELEVYHQTLNINNSGIMGYIEISKIRVKLPIYHTIEDDVLQSAVGHLPGSSLPVGGQGTHCVLSGHRGLPSAKLFTDIARLTEGDTFELHVLNEVLFYEVDQILTVLPSETAALTIDPNEDYCTLITCTPYGVNTHRLLVRGHRIENPEDLSSARVPADAVKVDSLLVAPVVALPMLLILLILTFTKRPKKNRGGAFDHEK